MDFDVRSVNLCTKSAFKQKKEYSVEASLRYLSGHCHPVRQVPLSRHAPLLLG